MRIGAAIPLEDILEADWRKDVVKLAKQLGWRTYFTFNSRGSSFGFPDLVLTRDRVLFIELKREKTGPTDDQKSWLRDLHAAGAEAYIVRPRDLDLIGAVLASRPLLQPSEAAARLHLQTAEEIAT